MRLTWKSLKIFSSVSIFSIKKLSSAGAKLGLSFSDVWRHLLQDWILVGMNSSRTKYFWANIKCKSQKWIGSYHWAQKLYSYIGYLTLTFILIIFPIITHTSSFDPLLYVELKSKAAKVSPKFVVRK